MSSGNITCGMPGDFHNCASVSIADYTAKYSAPESRNSETRGRDQRGTPSLRHAARVSGICHIAIIAEEGTKAQNQAVCSRRLRNMSPMVLADR